MAYQAINSSEVLAGQPVKESLMERIVENLDYHEAMIQSLGSGTAQTVVFNQILIFPEIPVGAAIWTWDTLNNSKATGLGKQWLNCAGSGSWTDGSGVSRTCPDARDRFLRMYHSTWTVATNLTYSDTTKRPTTAFTGTSNNPNTSTVSGGFHTHFIAVPGSSSSPLISTNYLVTDTGSGDFAYTLKGTNTSANVGLTGGSGEHNHTYPHTHTFSVTGGGDAETAPKHIYLNLLFKSDYSWGSFRLLYKAASSFSVTTVNLTKLEAGTASGTVTMDLRKATTAQLSAGSGSSSILSTLASITDNGITNFVEASGSIKTDGTQNIATNDWLYIEFTSKIAGCPEYHIQVIGS
jgi:hypothetical protein